MKLRLQYKEVDMRMKRCVIVMHPIRSYYRQVIWHLSHIGVVTHDGSNELFTDAHWHTDAARDIN